MMNYSDNSFPIAQSDTPKLINDEVCALVYRYLESKISVVSNVPIRMELLDVLSKSRPYFTSGYQGNGKYQVSAMGFGVEINIAQLKGNLKQWAAEAIKVVGVVEIIKQLQSYCMEQHYPSNLVREEGIKLSFYSNGGLWNIFELVGAIEPANDQATELIRYIQKWTK